MSEKIKVYRYKCPHCDEWAFYRPRKTPKMYKTGKEVPTGPATRHNGFQINLLKVPHSPKFPFEKEIN